MSAFQELEEVDSDSLVGFNGDNEMTLKTGSDEFA